MGEGLVDLENPLFGVGAGEGAPSRSGVSRLFGAALREREGRAAELEEAGDVAVVGERRDHEVVAARGAADLVDARAEGRLGVEGGEDVRRWFQ